MKTRFPFTATGWTLMACGALTLPSRAQDDDITIDRNRIWVSARFAFNITGEFRDVSSPAFNVPPRYDDGFVLPDASGGADGKTWYWGYQEADQIQGDTLSLHALGGTPSAGSSEEVDGDLQAGFEVVYGRALGFFNLSERRQAAWGVLGGFGSLDINIDTQSEASGAVSQRTDQFSLGGITAPYAPYAGTYNGPGPVIALNPIASSTGSVGATSRQYSRLDSMALGFKLGPFLELPLSNRLSVNLSAGLAVVDLRTTFEYEESLTLDGTGLAPLERTDKVDESEWLIGFFGNATVDYALTFNLSVFAGVQFQSLGESTLAGGGKEATLDLGQVFEAQVGIRASF